MSNIVNAGTVTARTGIRVSASTIQGAIIDNGAISAGIAGIRVDSAVVSGGLSIGSGGTLSAGKQGILIGSICQSHTLTVC